MDLIGWIVQRLMRVLPPTGRHRAGTGATCAQANQPADVPAVYSTPPVAGPMPRGEDIGHVRPYLVAHEQRQEAQRQRARRRTLWLAVHGVDFGPRMIYGVRVAG